MADNQSRKIFMNLAVRDLTCTMEFFAGLGFGFNTRFTNDQACMIVNPEAYVMLLTGPVLKTLTAVTCGSGTEVDEFVQRAIEAGGTCAMDAMDHGFMNGWNLYDSGRPPQGGLSGGGAIV